MDIGAWLSDLGLGQYETLFADNAVDSEVLPDLDEADLEKLGLPLGHRKRMLKAIAALRAPPPEVAPLAPSPRDEAERRPITIMFCDLVGSTGLAATLDAEDWRELVGAFFDEASQAVSTYGGHVLKNLGDGLMALFGFPRAQENDAERAARAALAILARLEAMSARNRLSGLPALAARIGLHSGPVVVDGTGEVFGDTPNVAARALAAAAPGTAVMTATTQRQVAGLFVADDMGPHDLKGVSGRPVLYRLVRASGGGRRGGARSLTPFVGRAEDLAALLRRWERARRGEGQLVQIVGEPGLGKSRLVQELHARIGETPHTWLEWSSSQLLQNTPLHPVAEWGRLRFGGADVPPAERMAQLERGLAQVNLDPAEHAPILAPLLDIPIPDSRLPKLPPEELRRRQHAAVVAWALNGARVQPMALVMEDLHWADPTTVDVLTALAELGASARLFIVMTTRPEFRAPWVARSHHAVLSLAPLDRAEIVKMVGSLAERHALSREAVERVSDRTGGVPLFVEEVTRLLLEGGPQTIPPTLQQSLAARLDRLGDAREVAQIGAVLGREFAYKTLNAVAGLPEPALKAALEKLVGSDLLFLEGAEPDARYRFKHALIQDAAYESLLKNRRQGLHRRAAEALLAGAERKPELVAHHFTQSGDIELAIDWWGKAGEAALRGLRVPGGDLPPRPRHRDGGRRRRVYLRIGRRPPHQTATGLRASRDVGEGLRGGGNQRRVRTGAAAVRRRGKSGQRAARLSRAVPRLVDARRTPVGGDGRGVVFSIGDDARRAVGHSRRAPPGRFRLRAGRQVCRLAGHARAGARGLVEPRAGRTRPVARARPDLRGEVGAGDDDDFARRF